LRGRLRGLRLCETGWVMAMTASEFAGVRVLDGGMATELERRGFDLSGPLWSAHVLDEAPEAIVAVHLDYLRAGADVIETASYQISALGYRELGREDWARAMRQSVELAEAARREYARESGRRVWIAGSLGPYGAALHNGAEFHGRYEIGFDELVGFHRERLAVMAETAADLVAVETVPSLEEARAIVAALDEVPGAAGWVSFTCRDGRHVAHGELLRNCARMLDWAERVLAVGINCTRPDHVAALIGEARTETGKPVVVYPNSGETWDAAARSWKGRGDLAAEEARFGAMAREWYAAGAQAVGGCCRTGPGHIRAVDQSSVGLPDDGKS
jgi:homocysteine S-methyltransferase